MKKIVQYLFFAMMAIMMFACGRGHKPSGSDNEVDPEQQLSEAIADETKLQSFQIMDEGLVLIDAYVNKKYLTLEYSCDESIISIEVFNGNKDLLKEAIFELIEQKEPETLEMIELLKATQRGIAYKYVGDKSGKSVAVCVESDEL